MSRIATIFGATGTQGGSVLNAILADGTFPPRAVSRKECSALVARGVEVVEADLWDLESVRKAVRGSESQIIWIPPKRVIRTSQPMLRREFGDAVVPDPRLVELGVKFGTMEEFVDTVVKARFAQ